MEQRIWNILASTCMYILSLKKRDLLSLEVALQTYGRHRILMPVCLPMLLSTWRRVFAFDFTRFHIPSLSLSFSLDSLPRRARLQRVRKKTPPKNAILFFLLFALWIKLVVSSLLRQSVSLNFGGGQCETEWRDQGQRKKRTRKVWEKRKSVELAERRILSLKINCGFTITAYQDWPKDNWTRTEGSFF